MGICWTDYTGRALLGRHRGNERPFQRSEVARDALKGPFCAVWADSGPKCAQTADSPATRVLRFRSPEPDPTRGAPPTAGTDEATAARAANPERNRMPRDPPAATREPPPADADPGRAGRTNRLLKRAEQQPPPIEGSAKPCGSGRAGGDTPAQFCPARALHSADVGLLQGTSQECRPDHGRPLQPSISNRRKTGGCVGA